MSFGQSITRSICTECGHELTDGDEIQNGAICIGCPCPLDHRLTDSLPDDEGRRATMDMDCIVYFEGLTRQGPVMVPGFPLCLAGYDQWFVVHRPLPLDDDKPAWRVSEVSTGRSGGFGDSIDEAVDSLLSKIPPPSRFAEMVAEVLRDQPGLQS